MSHPQPALSRLLLPGILLLAAGLRLWHLGVTGFSTEYYAAAVRSMLLNRHNLLFNAFDPAATLTIDKPPLALWAQVLSAHLLGYNAFALALPQAIEGTLSVLVLWWLVRRDFGTIAAALAALFLAITPISVAVDRSNNTDSLLVLVLLAAAALLPQRDDRAAPWRLAAALAMVGVAFNVKMLAAFGVLPGFAAGYLLSARATLLRRFMHLAAAGAVLLVVSASWVSFVALTPPADRPFVDSSADNSVLDLVVNHNAAQRFIPRPWRGALAEFAPRLATRIPPAGPERLAEPRLASQAIWLLPLALAGVVAMVLNATSLPACIWPACIWIGWAVCYGLVFSFAGGLFSPYYLVMLAPPLAALAGVGVVALARRWTRCAHAQPWLLPTILAASFAWQAHIMRLPINLPAAAAILVLLALGGRALASRPTASAASLAIGVIGLLITPTAWAIGTAQSSGPRPVARLEPDAPGPAYADADQITALLPFLIRNRGDARFLAVTATARLAAPLIIASGAEVAAIGGFTGTLPVMDEATLARLAASGDLRFVILGHLPWRRATLALTPSIAWVQTHGTRRDLATIAPGLDPRRFELYDLLPSQRPR